MDPDRLVNPYAPTNSTSDHDPFEPLRDPSLVEKVNPFVSIWFSPRVTIRWIIHSNPSYCVWLLAGLAGITDALDKASERDLGDTMELPTILGLTIVLGPIAGVVTLVIYSALVKWSGTWMGGRAEFEEVRAAMAWATVPTVACLVFWAVEIAVLGKETFQLLGPTANLSPSMEALLIAARFGQTILAFWYIILVCNTVAEVQGYQSAWRGFGNLILAGMVIMLPLILLGVLLIAII